MFDRYVSIDWSGARKEHDRVDLRVLEASATGCRLVSPPSRRSGVRGWTRAECRDWLLQVLGPDQPRAIVAMDFGFGLPWGADRSVFGCKGWREMLDHVSALYKENTTARAVAQFVNSKPEFGGHGPYRFNEDRANFRFYLDNGVAYFRVVELAVPEAMSQWYMGAGAAVGFHTITGLSALHSLMVERDKNTVDFEVWPQECDTPGNRKHLIVESYPAVFATPATPHPYQDDHERDARKVLEWMRTVDEANGLQVYFAITEAVFGRIEGVDIRDQIRFEGWMIGVR